MEEKKHFFGDARLLRSFRLLSVSMANRLSVKLRALSDGRSQEKAFGLFINHASVTPESIVRQYWHDRSTNWAGRDLLVYSDGSVLSFKQQANRKDLGYVGESDKVGGFELHNSLIVDMQSGLCYGVGGAQVQVTHLKSEADKKTWRQDCPKIPFEQKETYRWYSTMLQSVGNCPGASSYTAISDRESDIYELFDHYRQNNWNWVIRVTGDKRSVSDLTGKRMVLNRFLEPLSVNFSYEVKVCATKKRSAHTALLHVKYTPVVLLPPATGPAKNLPCIPSWVVEVREDPSTVRPGEPPVHWTLSTTHEVATEEQARKVILWYCDRWDIEQLYRTDKREGLNIEEAELETIHGLANLATLSLIAAAQVMALVMARDGNTHIPCQTVFTGDEMECLRQVNTKVEGPTEKQQNPFEVNSLAFAAWVIARLGGWTPYNKKRPAGPITMANGLVRFMAIYEGFSLFKSSMSKNDRDVGIP
jgi:hypothetical protein